MPSFLSIWSGKLRFSRYVPLPLFSIGIRPYVQKPKMQRALFPCSLENTKYRLYGEPPCSPYPRRNDQNLDIRLYVKSRNSKQPGNKEIEISFIWREKPIYGRGYKRAIQNIESVWNKSNVHR